MLDSIWNNIMAIWVYSMMALLPALKLCGVIQWSWWIVAPMAIVAPFVATFLLGMTFYAFVVIMILYIVLGVFFGSDE